MEPFRAFIKPFDAPRRTVKIKIYVLIFSLRLGLGREGLNSNISQVCITLQLLPLIYGQKHLTIITKNVPQKFQWYVLWGSSPWIETKLSVHMTYRGRTGHLLNILRMFNLDPASMGF